MTGKKDNLHPKINGKTGTKIQTAQKKQIPPECPATVAEAAGFVCSGPKRRDRPADIFHSTLSANIQTTKKNDPADIRLTNIYRVVFGIKKSVIT